MSKRGVTRPIALSGHGEPSGDGDHKSEGGGHQADAESRLEKLRTHHHHTIWIPWTFIVLGVWLMTAPWTFGYGNEGLWRDPSGGRGVWFSDATHTALRAALMTWSDLATGMVVVVLGWRCLKPDRPVSWWLVCGAGVWLTFAPILFWAPTSASFLNDTLVGILLIALSILVPGMPNMIMYMQHGEAQPPGWSYNPSSWAQRWILIATGFAGFVVTRVLAAFQLGYTEGVWEPFFGEGSRRVLNSDMSHMWPISDAGLGGISYTFEFLMGYMGSPARWRTMPWMVAFFGVLVIPLGLTHIILVICQPLVVGHWCTLCLIAAAIMLPMIPLEVDEVIAMLQHVRDARRRGDRGSSTWRIFWKGGSADGCAEDTRSPGIAQFHDHPVRVVRASLWGFSMPWTLLVSTALGVGVMFVPAALEVSKPASHVHHLCGALVVVVSVISMGETVRLGRWLNVPLGVGLGAVPWFLEGGEQVSRMVATALGVLVIGMSVPRGVIRERFGDWDRFVR